MVFKGVSWTSVVFSLVLYCIVFLTVRFGMVMEGAAWAQARPGLLVFIIPGAVAALMSKEYPLTVSLLSALLATPFCLIFLQYYSMDYGAILQELAFDTSAIFWYGLGALGIMLFRTLFWHSHS